MSSRKKKTSMERVTLDSVRARCPFVLRDKKQFAALMKHNSSRHENLWHWRARLNIHVAAVSVLIFYITLWSVCLLGYVVDLDYDILDPLSSFTLFATLSLVFLGMGFGAIGGMFLTDYFQTIKTSYYVFDEHYQVFDGKYVKHEKVSQLLGPGSHTVSNELVFSNLRVTYMDKYGEQHIAYSFLGNESIYSQFKAGQQLQIYRIKGLWNRYVDIALIPWFVQNNPEELQKNAKYAELTDETFLALDPDEYEDVVDEILDLPSEE